MGKLRRERGWQYRLAQVQRTLESPEKTDDNGQQQTKTDVAYWSGERRRLVWVAGGVRWLAVRLSGRREDPCVTGENGRQRTATDKNGRRLLVQREAALGVGSWLTAAVCSTPVGQESRPLSHL